MEKPSLITLTTRFSKFWTSKLNIDVGDRGRKTELHLAAIAGDYEEISNLLRERRKSTLTMPRKDTAVDVNAQDELGRSALHWAVAQPDRKVIAQQYKDCTERLMGHPEMDCILRDKDGRTPLHEAAMRGHDDIVRLLLENEKICENINTGDNRQRTALHWAAENGKEKVVQVLLDEGNGHDKADVNAKDNCGGTPLHRAVRSGHESSVQRLIKDASAENKATALSFELSLAAEKGRLKTTMVLLKNKIFEEEDGVAVASLVEKDRTTGEVLLIWAANKGHESVVQQLLQTGQVDVNTEDKAGRTPLLLATENRYLAVIKQLLKTDRVNVNTKGYLGRTPLSVAAENGCKAIVRQLLETGQVNVDIKNKYGRTPLSLAAKNGHEAVVQQLLQTGQVDVNTEDKGGRTPLLLAAENGHEAVVQQLLKTGLVDVNTKDKDGRTPLSLATENEHEAVIKLLESVE